jgi:hypothetical protein
VQTRAAPAAGPRTPAAIIALQSEIAASALDLDRVMELVAARGAELTGADAGVVEIAEGDEMVYRRRAGRPRLTAACA